MIPRIVQTDYGYYALKYLDGEGNVILPDLDTSLYWEFYDATDTLKFTATLLSTPAITQDSDSEGAFLKVTGIDLASWALGIVYAKCFAKKDTDDIQPAPMLANAFEIIAGFDGYCSTTDVIQLTGIKYQDLELSNDTELDIVLAGWILDATDIIDIWTNNSWQDIAVPRGIKNICMRMVANLVHLSVERRKSPLVQIGDFNIEMIEDAMLTDEIKKLMEYYTLKKKINQSTQIFAATVVRNAEDEEAEESDD